MDLISPLTAAVLGLALHQAAYAAEVVRSGFLSVDQGQLEAAAALGIPKLRQFRRILLPQAMRTILPTAGNELIGLVKGTSVVYIMALSELFYQVQVIYTRNGTGDSAAAGRGDLVPGADHGDVDRAVLHRAVLRARGAAGRAADAAAAVRVARGAHRVRRRLRQSGAGMSAGLRPDRHG